MKYFVQSIFFFIEEIFGSMFESAKEYLEKLDSKIQDWCRLENMIYNISEENFQEIQDLVKTFDHIYHESIGMLIIYASSYKLLSYKLLGQIFMSLDFKPSRKTINSFQRYINSLINQNNGDSIQ